MSTLAAELQAVLDESMPLHMCFFMHGPEDADAHLNHCFHDVLTEVHAECKKWAAIATEVCARANATRCLALTV
jgi:hypothetical protein